MWIVDDELDASLPLPRGERDIPLMIADRTFDRHNQLTDPFTDLRPPADGVTGHSVLVNGVHMPHHRVTPRRHRLRILNASAVPRLQPLSLQRDADDPDRHRQRPDAEAGAGAARS